MTNFVDNKYIKIQRQYREIQGGFPTMGKLAYSRPISPFFKIGQERNLLINKEISK